jgi:hypothetical protein
MLESEAHAIRFAIDHYEPQAARPDLRDAYANLMWSCDECNARKGDRCPPDSAREQGYRFFRPDEDVRDEHFRSGGIRVEPNTNVGFYSIEALDLNRRSLLRLRELRQRLYGASPMVTEGISALKKLRIDRLPPNIRGRAVTAMKRMERVAEKFEADIDEMLRNFARSALIDPDTSPDAETRAKDRVEKLEGLEVMFPGVWRGRKQKA